jgi:hypothetical protein
VICRALPPLLLRCCSLACLLVSTLNFATFNLTCCLAFVPDRSLAFSVVVSLTVGGEALSGVK